MTMILNYGFVVLVTVVVTTAVQQIRLAVVRDHTHRGHWDYISFLANIFFAVTACNSAQLPLTDVMDRYEAITTITAVNRGDAVKNGQMVHVI